MSNLLERYAKAYYAGNPLIDDATYDYLENVYGRGAIGSVGGDVEHYKQMYSLEKVYVGEKLKLQEYNLIESPKLDGCAIALVYDKGILVQAATRGDGKVGVDVLDKALLLGSIPYTIEYLEKTQITGEIVCPRDIENARNYASGSMNLKDMVKFRNRVQFLDFVAYGVSELGNLLYTKDMQELQSCGFDTILLDRVDKYEKYRTDGTVYRIDCNNTFRVLGHTAKHPKGAFALKDKDDVAIEEAELLSVEWQVGSSGKVCPVAHFTEVVIEDAKITKATLHNAGFVEDLKLSVGDTIFVTRAGGVIPAIVGKKDD